MKHPTWLAARPTSAVLLLFACVSLRAATYHVATNGTDAPGNGSLTAPLRTINYAAGLVNPGDVVEVHAGVYNELVTIARGGTSAARVTFRGYNGEVPIVDGTGLGTSSNITISAAAGYVTIDGFESRNSGKHGVRIIAGPGSIVKNCKLHHNQYNGIYTDTGASALQILDNEVYFNVQRNNVNQMSGGWDQGIQLRASNSLIQGNYVHDNHGEGIGCQAGVSGVTIEFNTVEHNHSQGIYLDHASYITVRQNLVSNDGQAQYRVGKGITIADEAAGGPPTSTQNTIVNNIVVGCGRGFAYFWYQTGSGLKYTTIANNTFIKPTEAGIRIYGGAGSNVGSVIRNNIVVIDPAVNRFVISFDGSSGGNVAADTLVQNNQLYSVGNTETSANQFRYNSNSVSYNGFIASSANFTNNRWGDPKLINYAGWTASDCQLAGNSPAIDVGSSTAAPTVDYFEGVRPKDGDGNGGSAFDIGAHEYTADGIDDFNDGAYADWVQWTGAGAGTVTVTGSTSVPDGSAKSGLFTYTRTGTSYEYMILKKTTSAFGQVWNTNQRSGIRFWIKGDATNSASYTGASFRVQLREGDNGERWEANIGTVGSWTVQSGSWTQVYVPFSSMTLNPQGGNGILDVTSLDQVRFYIPNGVPVAGTLKVNVDNLQAY